MVINGHGDRNRIPRETQDRVHAAVAVLGYTPNRSLRNLFLGTSADFLAEAARRMDTDTLITTLGPVFAERGIAFLSPTPQPAPAPEPAPQPAPSATAPEPVSAPEPTPNPEGDDDRAACGIPAG